jgi:hypothetical protein
MVLPLMVKVEPGTTAPNTNTSFKDGSLAPSRGCTTVTKAGVEA